MQRIAGLSLDIPVLIAAKNALDVLKTSAYVEVDCESGVEVRTKTGV